jgi:hypothetical protein
MIPVNFPGPVPYYRGQPRPEAPAQGNVWQDAGQAIGELGGDATNMQKDMDTRADLVNRRKEALRLQRMKEDMDKADLEYKEAEQEERIAKGQREESDRQRSYDLETEKEKNRQAYRMKALEKKKEEAAEKAAKSAKKKKEKANSPNLKGYSQTTQRELMKIHKGQVQEEAVTKSNRTRVDRAANDLKVFQDYLDRYENDPSANTSKRYIKIRNMVPKLALELKERQELDSVLRQGTWRNTQEAYADPSDDDYGQPDSAGGGGVPADPESIDNAIQWLEDNPDDPDAPQIRSWLKGQGYL